MRLLLCAVATLMLVACGGGPPEPAELLAGTSCSHCRMAVSDPKLAAQIAARGEEPRFFDDIGCLASYLKDHPLSEGAAAYVADHVSGAWIPIERAVYSRSDTLATPMGSHIVAHASDQARAADTSVRDAQRLTMADVFPARASGGGR